MTEAAEVKNIIDRYPHEEVCVNGGDDYCDNPDHPKAPTGYQGRMQCTLPLDSGTMPENVQKLRNEVIGRKIISAENGTIAVPGEGAWINGRWDRNAAQNVEGLILTLDDGRRVLLADDGDCCAYTSLEAFLLNPLAVDHVILGVGTENGYETWHIYADMSDVLTLTVGWSCGNPFYYGYGFNIKVIPADDRQ